jgi:hypothetical protein
VFKKKPPPLSRSRVLSGEEALQQKPSIVKSSLKLWVPKRTLVAVAFSSTLALCAVLGLSLLRENVHDTIREVFSTQASTPQGLLSPNLALEGVMSFTTFLVFSPLIPFGVSLAVTGVSFATPLGPSLVSFFTSFIRRFIRGIGLFCEAYVSLAMNLLPLLILITVFGFFYKGERAWWISWIGALVTIIVGKKAYKRFLTILYTPLVGIRSGANFSSSKKTASLWIATNPKKGLIGCLITLGLAYMTTLVLGELVSYPRIQGPLIGLFAVLLPSYGWGLFCNAQFSQSFGKTLESSELDQ